ncbi:hypothetical protein KIMH_09370 [Bombiscardovia apis]|uniref:Uncharacterized protein n=1 Tax=Bombiscardovia apis TaxID=2932182 RepID=A0ABM8BD54_9BIFI|nr:DUF6725 family protein [Bombiscardovia apis]BDR54826.1 hypothetical protein KIMH_09370 [Bombiscardovia apis]
MKLPQQMPQGARIVVRVQAGIDQQDGRMKYSDYIGHVKSWNGEILQLTRDPAANGTRPAQEVSIPAASIVSLKPIPERRYPFGR